MKLNLSEKQLKDLVEDAADDCGKKVYVGYGSLHDHEMFSTKYVVIRGKDGLFHVSDFLSAKDYVEWEGANYFIHARVYFNPGNKRNVVTQVKLYEYVDNKEGTLHGTVYFKSSYNGYMQDLASYIHQLNLRLAEIENA